MGKREWRYSVDAVDGMQTDAPLAYVLQAIAERVEAVVDIFDRVEAEVRDDTQQEVV